MMRFREFREVERHFDTDFDPDKRISRHTSTPSTSTTSIFDPDKRIDVTKTTTTSSSDEYDPDDRVILF